MQNEITELKEALAKLTIQFSTDSDSYKTQIEELNVTIEELMSENEKLETIVEKEEQENSAAG